MSVRGRIIKVRSEFKSGALFRERPGFKLAAGYGLNFTLGLMMASARVLGSCGPFGVAIVARAGAGLGGIFCVLGAAFGYLISGGLDWGVRYIAASVLVFTAAFVFQTAKAARKVWFMPVIAAGVMAVTGFLNSFEAGASGAARMLMEAVLSGGSAYFFSIALSEAPPETEAQEKRRGVSLLILAACALMSVSQISVMSVISVGRLIAVLMVMTSAFRGGLLTGAASGTALGLAMDISCGGTPYFSMAYSFAGLLSGVFVKHGRVLFVLSYILANAVAVAWTLESGFRSEALFEAFAASVIFMLLPTGLLNHIGGLISPDSPTHGEVALRRHAAKRVSRLGEAFGDLFETVRRGLSEENNDNDIARVFDRAADIVCASCKLKNNCWNINYLETLNTMNDATAAMLSRGSLRREDLPERFTGECRHVYQFISAVNGELRGMMYRRKFKSRMSENRVAAYGQYLDLAEIFESVSRDISRAPGSDPLAERRLARFLNGIDVEGTSSVFRDGAGRLRAVIESDRLSPLTRDHEYLDKLSGVLGVRLCRLASENSVSEGRVTLLEAEPLAVSVGVAAMKKKGEPVSGDRGTYFKTDQGILCVILSDGMGSGDEAAKESSSVVRILEKFLRSGVPPATAMKILNSVMLLKNSDEWGFATVDLMCIDLFSGEAAFYKYGAAPSYVRYGSTIRRVRCDTMAAGMTVGEGAAPDVMRLKLRPGSLAVIASDGVMVDGDDMWLRELLAGYEGRDTKALARSALQLAVKQYGCEDDMTVLAVYVDERS